MFAVQEPEIFKMDESGLGLRYHVGWDLSVVLANVVNYYVSTNERPLYCSDVINMPEPLRSAWSDLVRSDARRFVSSTVDSIGRATMWRGGEGEFGPEAIEFSTMVQNVLLHIDRLYEPHLNWSDTLAARLAEYGWAPVYVSHAALPVPERYLQAPTRVRCADLDMEASFLLPGGTNSLSTMMRDMLWLLDMPRLSVKVLPTLSASTKIEGFPATERPIGEILRSRRLIQRLIALMTLHELQGVALWLASTHRLHRMASSILRARPNVDAQTLRMDADHIEALDRLIEMLPVHDLVSLIDDQSGRVKTSGHFGDAYASVWPAMKRLSGPEFASTLLDLQTKPSEAQPYESLILDTYLDVLRAAHDRNKPLSWSEFMSYSADLDQADEWLTIEDVLDAIGSNPILGDMKNIAAELGWKRMTADDIFVDYYGAPFSLSDGDHASESPFASLIGAVPTLGLNERAPHGVGVHIDTAFNPPDPLPRSHFGRDGNECMMTFVCGFAHASAPNTAWRWWRYYLPAGCWLGEEGTDPVMLAWRNNSPAYKTLIAFLSTMNPKGTLRRWYHHARLDDDAVRSEPNFRANSIADYATGATSLEAHETWAVVYRDQLIELSEAEFRHRDEPFRKRVPVMMSITPDLVYTVGDGSVLGQLRRRSTVAYLENCGREAELVHSYDKLEAITSFMDDAFGREGVGGITQQMTTS